MQKATPYSVRCPSWSSTRNSTPKTFETRRTQLEKETSVQQQFEAPKRCPKPKKPVSGDPCSSLRPWHAPLQAPLERAHRAFLSAPRGCPRLGRSPPRRSGGGRTCGGWAVGRLGVGGWRCAELFQVKQNQDILVHWYLLTSYSYVVKPGGGNWM